MKFNTKHFGEVEIEENEIINFIGGVPGFEGNRYVIINSSDEEVSPFVWLQSVEDGDVALVLMNVFLLYPEYAPDIDEDILKDLEFNEMEDIAAFNVVVIPDKVEDMTVNLKAPILINNKNKLAIQAIANNNEYEIKHKIYEDLKKLVESKQC